jgi:phenylacetate-coenzyme A ligase PaaK-like adenylate-forming protein
VSDPFVHYEIVDDEGRPVDDGGVGELTPTELFPFLQQQHLVRYRIGDLARRVAGITAGRLESELIGWKSQCTLGPDPV